MDSLPGARATPDCRPGLDVPEEGLSPGLISKDLGDLGTLQPSNSARVQGRQAALALRHWHRLPSPGSRLACLPCNFTPKQTRRTGMPAESFACERSRLRLAIYGNKPFSAGGDWNSSQACLPPAQARRATAFASHPDGYDMSQRVPRVSLFLPPDEDGIAAANIVAVNIKRGAGHELGGGSSVSC